MDRVKTGVLGLDPLLDGGYIPNSVNVVLGSAGTGKTLFSIQFVLRGLIRGQKRIMLHS